MQLRPFRIIFAIVIILSGAHCLKSESKPSPPPGKRWVYICPMHPEHRYAHPGICPICGMELKPTFAPDSVTPEENP
jgi:hypothetical protein